jgi:hypothetical protein
LYQAVPSCQSRLQDGKGAGISSLTRNHGLPQMANEGRECIAVTNSLYFPPRKIQLARLIRPISPDLIPGQRALLITNMNEIRFHSTAIAARGSLILPAQARPCHNLLHSYLYSCQLCSRCHQKSTNSRTSPRAISPSMIARDKKQLIRYLHRIFEPPLILGQRRVPFCAAPHSYK